MCRRENVSICLFPCLGMLGMIGMFILSIFMPPTKFLCLHSHVKVMFNITCVTQCGVILSVLM